MCKSEFDAEIRLCEIRDESHRALVQWVLGGEVGFCAVGVGKEGFAQVAQAAGLVVAVGVGAVLESCRNGSVSTVHLC